MSEETNETEVEDGPRVPADVMEKLRGQHGEVIECAVGPYAFAFKPANEIQYMRCLSTAMSDAKSRPKAMVRLAFDCVVYPEANAFAALNERRPGVAIKLGDKIIAVANGNEDDVAGKG